MKLAPVLSLILPVLYRENIHIAKIKGNYRLIIFCWFSTFHYDDFTDTIVYHIVTRGDKYELLLYS